MKKIYYEKLLSNAGRVIYKPVAEYDSEYIDSFPKGNHLVMCYPGGQSRRYNIDPNYAAMIAAGRAAEDAIAHAILVASELRPQQTPVTKGQQRAWKKLAKEFGDELCTLSHSSAHDIAQVAIKALQKEADVLYSNPAVKKAYEHFLLVAELTKD
jgi:hypothetical protein